MRISTAILHVVATGALFVVGLAVTIEASFAGQCLKDAREIKLDKENVARLANYLCRSDRDPRVELRVEFQRLGQLTAGALLIGGAAPWLDMFYGKHMILNNEVLKEYKTLIERFGVMVEETHRGGGDVTLWINVETPEQKAAGEVAGAHAKKGQKIRSFRLSNLPDVPLVDESIQILNEQKWPSSLSMNYEKPSEHYGPRGFLVQGTVLDRMTVWRYLTPQDIEQFSERLQKYNALLGYPEHDLREANPKSLQLLAYLTANGWPDPFLIASTSIIFQEACGPFDFTVHQYELKVDIAIIENVSSKPIRIDSLLGRGENENRLRPVSQASTRMGDANELKFTPTALDQGERLIVPLALIFDSGEAPSEEEALEQRKQSTEAYESLLALKAGTVLKTSVHSAFQGKAKIKDLQGDVVYVIKKVRESFKPPSYPIESDYAFGPQWWLSGFEIDGERTSLDSAPPNFINLSAGIEAGSCPILYAWNDEASRWLRHGKIIHRAQSRANETSETVELSGFVDRFKIAEEELELSHLDEVKLSIELNDGTIRNLQSDNKTIAEKDGVHLRLFAHDGVEIRFNLPKDVAASGVKTSRLTVTGFYDRYAALLAERVLGSQTYTSIQLERE